MKKSEDFPFTHDGNDNETYYIFYKGKIILEVFLSEDRVLDLIWILNSKRTLQDDFINWLELDLFNIPLKNEIQ